MTFPTFGLLSAFAPRLPTLQDPNASGSTLILSVDAWLPKAVNSRHERLWATISRVSICEASVVAKSKDPNPLNIMRNSPNNLLRFKLGFAFLALVPFGIQRAGADGWTTNGPLASARYYHAASLLLNGMVLVSAGEGTASALSSAELYDPAAGAWNSTGPMQTARFNHTMTLLPNGEVLVAGGSLASEYATSSAELYDPASGTWLTTGSLGTARYGHTATLLPNGMVLVAGGNNATPTMFSSAELYDPSSGLWTATGSMNNARANHTATLLVDGTVLVAGGGTTATAEVYDPATGAWVLTNSMSTARAYHTATLLPTGDVLVAGGRNGSGVYLSSAEVYHPATGTWMVAGAMANARAYHAAALLPSGKVVVVGGSNSSNPSLPNAEVYDPAAGAWTTTGALATGRINHTATALSNGQVLVAGGRTKTGLAYVALSSVELYSATSGTNAPPSLTGCTMLTNGSFAFTFTNTIGTICTACSTTNLVLPLTNWTVLGVAMELPPGQYQFNDPQATNSPQFFYRVCSP